MTLDSSSYGDPMIVAMRNQARERKALKVCDGCIHKRVLFVGEEKVQACALKRGWSPSIFCNLKQTEK